uniref:Myticalin C8 n=1 Tax=Mytilus galloprovincialis TaxID=29158 RepID=A0A286RMV0_MYTGA|nr:myticalin C8 [Mytilus galloprovincialis]
MKGVVLMLLTLLVALYMINECEGRRRRWRRIRRGISHRLPKFATLNSDRKREMLNDDSQDEDIESVDSEDGHLDERYVNMNDNGDVMDDINERYLNDHKEDD